MNNTLIIAHRGESYEAPENSLSSIKLAYDLGANAVEIDVRLTKDNQIVVIHDAHTWRVAHKLRWISLSRLKKLKKIDIGYLKDDKFKGERIPTLEETLDLVPKTKSIIIEIKSNRRIIPFLKQMIENSELNLNQIQFIGFNLKLLTELKKIYPENVILWIHSLDYYWIRKLFRPSLNRIISKVKQNNLDGLDLWASRKLNQRSVQKIKFENLKLYLWTIDSVKSAMRFINWGADGITTNRAFWIKNQIES